MSHGCFRSACRDSHGGQRKVLYVKLEFENQKKNFEIQNLVSSVIWIFQKKFDVKLWGHIARSIDKIIEDSCLF